MFFENIKLHNCTERAYTLYCAAKDLTLGTKHLTVSDLSDADLVPPMLFRTICNAMAVSYTHLFENTVISVLLVK